MPSIIQQSFKVNLTAMRIFFLYPPEQYKVLYQIFRYLAYFCLVVPVPMLQIVNLIIEENIGFSRIADNVFLMAELLCFVGKLCPFYNNAERMKKCILYFDAPFFEARKKEHEKILNDCIKICRRTTSLFVVAVASGFISWCIRPISWENHTFPTDVWTPFDVKTAPKSYICIVYAYIIMGVGYISSVCAVLDSLIACLAYHAAAQVKILKHNLQFLEEDTCEELKDDVDNLTKKTQLMYDKIRQCSIHYELIIEFVQEYEHCFSHLAFIQFVTGIVVLCVSCLQLTIVEVASFDFLAMIMYLIAMLSESYLYCHFGTALYTESDSIIEAIYLGQWYKYDLKCRKALMILMERAKKPMIITCGKLVDMSVDTFTMMLRRSYSLLAVLENYSIDLS